MAKSTSQNGPGCALAIALTFAFILVVAGQVVPGVALGVIAAVIVYVASRKTTTKPTGVEVVTPAERIQRLRDELEFFRDYENQYHEDVPSGFVFKRGEHAIATVSGAALVESRRGPTQLRGGATGVSFRATDRISLRQSAFRGKAVPGEETPTVIDEGSFVVTSERGFFVGQKQTREFPWAKLLSFQVVEFDANACIMYLPVSGRQKVSGIGTDTKAMDEIEQRVAFAIALVTGRRDDFIKRIEDELRSLESGASTETVDNSDAPPTA